MTITSYQVQNVLRTYGRHLLRGRLKALGLPQKQSQLHWERAAVAENRRRQVIDQVVQEMLRKIASEGITGETEKEALGRLSREVGRSLHIVADGEQWHFAVPAESSVRGTLPLCPDGQEALKERFYKITYEIIDQNTLAR